MGHFRPGRKRFLFSLFYLTVCFMGIPSLMPAQSLYPGIFRFTSYTINEGLSESAVSALAEDKYGQISIATQKGLDIFNGYEFYHISTTDYQRQEGRPEITPGMISSISTWQKGYLFVASNDGHSFLFDPSERLFIPTDSLLHFSNRHNQWKFRQINCILNTKEGESWIGTDKGILILRQQQVIPSFQWIFSSDSSAILKLCRDKQGRIWALTDSSELIGFGMQDKKRLFEVSPLFFNTKEQHIVMYGGPAGNIFLGTSEGVYCLDSMKAGHPVFQRLIFNYKGKQFKDVWVSCLLRDQSGLLWVGTYNKGIILYDMYRGEMVGKLEHTPFYPQSLNNNTVDCMIEDSHNRIWIGTENGINKFDPYSRKFTLYDQDLVDPAEKLSVVFSITGVDSFHIMALSKGRPVLINTRTHRLDYPAFLPGLDNNTWLSYLAKDHAGQIWGGSVSGGLYVIRKRGGSYVIDSVRAPELSTLQSSYLYALLPLGDSLMWIGTKREGGLYLWNRKTNALTHYTHREKDPHSIPDNMINVIFQDQNHNIWVGTHNGLGRYDPSKDQFDNFLNIKEGRAEKPWKLQHITQAGNYMWIGTYNKGLIRFNMKTGQFKTYTTADGLPDNNVYACAMDEKGHLWFSSDKGVTQFLISERTFRNFTVEDGLQSNEFDVASVYKNAKGEIFFGGVYGINKINPEKIVMDSLPVPLMISNISVLSPEQNYDIFPGDQHTFHFSHHENTLLIQFEALNYINPQFNRYRYKLVPQERPGKLDLSKDNDLFSPLSFEGFMDNTWIDAGNKNTVMYSQLSPGAYTFKVNAMNEDGIWNKEPLAYTIIIQPPYWDTGWFRALVLLFILMLLYGVYRLRMQAVRKAHKQKMERAELDRKIMHLERMALQAQMNPHFIFNSLNSIKGYILSSETDEAVDYLNDFAALIRKVLQHSKKDTILLSDELEAIESYVKLEERRLKKKVYLSVKAEDGTCLNSVFIPPLIIQPFIENAIWHGFRFKQGDGKIDITAREESDFLRVCITDNGVGREKARGFRLGRFKMQSMGVSITQERLMHFNGRKIKNIIYEDLPGHQGTKVILWIPLDGTRG